MELHISETKGVMGQAAAEQAAKAIVRAVLDKGEANIVVATGASQFEMLAALVQLDVPWDKVTAFHLDEYIGLPITHPASFRKYLNERFVTKVRGLRMFNGVNGEAADSAAECARLGELIGAVSIDVACIGIGENGHLAFNDPPADFDTDDAYIVVDLDEKCRGQQVGEGWFATVADVPTQAISMGIRQIMKAACIVCTVPDLRKAQAVKDAVNGPVTNMVPASILQHHPDCHLFLDAPAASTLEQ